MVAGSSSISAAAPGEGGGRSRQASAPQLSDPHRRPVVSRNLSAFPSPCSISRSQPSAPFPSLHLGPRLQAPWKTLFSPPGLCPVLHSPNSPLCSPQDWFVYSSLSRHCLTTALHRSAPDNPQTFRSCPIPLVAHPSSFPGGTSGPMHPFSAPLPRGPPNSSGARGPMVCLLSAKGWGLQKFVKESHPTLSPRRQSDVRDRASKAPAPVWDKLGRKLWSQGL